MKKMVEKMLAVAIITNLSVLNVALVGKNATLAAIEALEEQGIIVNKTNILFDAYLKNSSNSNVHEMNVKIGEVNNLFIEVRIQDAGVLNNGVIKLSDSNMKFVVEQIESDYVKNVTETQIELNQMRYGESVILEIPVVFVQPSSVDIDYMQKSNVVTLSGEYKEDENENSVQSDILVKMNYTDDAEVNVNSTFEKNLLLDSGKVMVEQVIESTVVDNKLPKEEETVTVNVPEIDGMKPESVVVIVNDQKQEEGTGYTYDSEKAVIEIENNKSENGKVEWKTVEDEYKVIYTYSEELNTEERNIENKVEVQTNLLTKSAVVSKEISEVQLVEVKGAVIDIETISQTPNKGYMYSKTNTTEYKELINVNISSLEHENGITIGSGNTKLVLESGSTVDISGKVQYTKIEVSKYELLELVGKEGTLTIKNENGDTIATINQDSEVSSIGVVTVNIPENSGEIKLVLSDLENEGTLEFATTRKMDADLGVDTSVLKQAVAIQEIKTANNLGYIATTNLAETVSTATLQTSNTIFNVFEENKDVQMIVNFNTSSNAYDLYKNPTVRVKMPDEIKGLTVNKAEIVYSDELTISNIYADGTDLVVEISGEQTTYTEEAITGPALILDFNVTLNENAARQEKELLVEYTNENAKTYASGETGIITSSVNITTPKDMTLLNTIEGLGITTFGIEESKELILESGKGAITTTNKVEVVNNNGYNVENAKVIGEFGTNSSTNSMGIKLVERLNVTGVENYTVYYTENENATSDLNNQENGWSTEVSNGETVKKYLVNVDEFEVAADMQIAYAIEIPENLNDGVEAQTGYEVVYTNSVNMETTIESTEVTLKTSEAAKFTSTMEGSVGGETLGSTVKQNAVITYTAKVKNDGTEEKTDVQITAYIPEGTKLMTFDEEDMVFNQLDDKTITSTIEKLAPGEEAIITYDVIVSSKTSVDTELTSYVEVTAGTTTAQSEEITTKVVAGDLGVIIQRRTNLSEDTMNYQQYSYYVIVENISDSEMTNIVVNNPFEEIGTVSRAVEVSEKIIAEDNGNVTIEKIDANDYAAIMYTVTIQLEDAFTTTEKDLVATLKVGDETYTSNVWTETIVGYGASITGTSNSAKEVYAGDSVVYEYVIENKGTSTLENLTFNTKISDELTIQKIIVNGTEFEPEYRDVEVIFNLSEKTEIVIETIVRESAMRTEDEVISNTGTVSNWYRILDTTESIEHIVKISEVENDSGLADRVEQAEITLATNGGSEIQANDKVVYEYVIKNTGNVAINYAEFKVTMPSQLEVNTVYKDGYEYGVDNYIITIPVNLSEDVVIRIEATVKSGITEDVTISNLGKVYYNGVEIGKSNEIIQTVLASDIIVDESYKQITGTAWLDGNSNGVQESDESLLSGIVVKAVDITTNKYATNSNGAVISATTNSSGKYTLNVPEGKYILVFEYNETKYKLAKYKADESSIDSDVFENEITISGVTTTEAITDIITVGENNISNINIGLVENTTFDLKLDKYVSNIVLVNGNSTTTKEYNRETLVKIELDKNAIDSTDAIIEYEIVVTNVGDISGYVKNIVDYLPSDVTFNSELNTTWYMENGKLYCNALYNQEILPGEEKVVKLIVTKSLSGTGPALTTNRAEIYEAENDKGLDDVNSTPGNNTDGENDLGIAEIIITIGTGSAVVSTIGIIGMTGLSVMGVKMYKKKNDLKEESK